MAASSPSTAMSTISAATMSVLYCSTDWNSDGWSVRTLLRSRVKVVSLSLKSSLKYEVSQSRLSFVKRRLNPVETLTHSRSESRWTRPQTNHKRGQVLVRKNDKRKIIVCAGEFLFRTYKSEIRTPFFKDSSVRFFLITESPFGLEI